MYDDRAVSIAITHGLTIAITAILVTGLLFGAGNLLENQERRVAQAQFDEIGSDLVSQIDTLDALNETGEDVEVSVQPTYPDQVGGRQWNVELTDDPERVDAEYAVRITSPLYDRPIEYSINTTSADLIESTPANSDRPLLRLCNDGTIQFRECP